MRKLTISVLLIVIGFSVVFAAPFIVSDPQTDATKFRMRLSADNGATWGEWVEGDPVNGGAKFDVSQIPKGKYRGEMQAGAYASVTDLTTNQKTTVWLWSNSAPFELDQSLPTTPKTIKVVE